MICHVSAAARHASTSWTPASRRCSAATVASSPRVRGEIPPLASRAKSRVGAGEERRGELAGVGHAGLVVAGARVLGEIGRDLDAEPRRGFDVERVVGVVGRANRVGGDA